MRIRVLVTSLFVTLLCHPQYQSPAIGYGEPVNTGFKVGTLPGVFGVSGKGAATYSIPLEAAPGTAGLAPGLAVTYNSHYPNGILGIGWVLEGLSEITRINKDYYHDNTTSVASLRGTDVFAIDSVRLIPISGNHPFAGTVYAREYESFDKITSKGSQGSGPEWFELLTKNGSTIEYGKTSDSRVLSSGGGTVIRWRINRIKDNNGNYIDFIYNVEQRESTISEIRYTGNDALMLNPYNRIIFDYKLKSDPSFYYIGDDKIPQTKILNYIRVLTEGNQMVREYTFRYHFDFYTHLNEIYETGSDFSRVNSTIFQWGGAATQYSYSYINDYGKNLKFIHGDFNGDGIMDLLYIVRKSTYSSSDKWTIILNKTAASGPYSGYLDATFKDFIVFDFNGDGKDDLLRRRRTGNTEYLDIYEFNGSTLTLVQSNYFSFYAATPAHTIHIADFNGDGKKDIMVLNSAKNIVGFKGFDHTGPAPGFNNPQQVILGDFNGDKKTDILVLKNNEGYTYTYNPVKPGWDTIYTSMYPGLSFLKGTDRIYTGDFNGDKKTDVLFYRNGWNLAWSGGFLSSRHPRHPLCVHTIPVLLCQTTTTLLVTLMVMEKMISLKCINPVPPLKRLMSSIPKVTEHS